MFFFSSVKEAIMKAQAIKQNIGVDVSKDTLAVCFYELLNDQRKRIKGSRSFKNTPQGFQALHEWISRKKAAQLNPTLTVEATGVYHESVAHFMSQTGYQVSVVLGNKAKAYLQSFNIKTKTDRVDAKVLGLMGLERDLEVWQALSMQLRQLKQLTRERVNLLEEKTALDNKLHALEHAFETDQATLQRLRVRLALYDQQVQEVENQIEQVVASDSQMHSRVKKICLVKGLGLVTVATIIAETNGFMLFTNRSQLVSYAGYDVVEKQSGSSISGKTRISKKGNRFIRRALHFPALTAIRYEPTFKRLYERIYERSGIKMKGVVAVQRKLLVLIYTLYTKNEAYDPNYEQRKENPERGRQDANPAYAG